MEAHVTSPRRELISPVREYQPKLAKSVCCLPPTLFCFLCCISWAELLSVQHTVHVRRQQFAEYTVPLYKGRLEDHRDVPAP